MAGAGATNTVFEIARSAEPMQVPLILGEDFQHGQRLEGIGFVNPLTPDFDLAAWL